MASSYSRHDPINIVLSHMKQRLKKHNNASNSDNLLDILCDIWEELTDDVQNLIWSIGRRVRALHDLITIQFTLLDHYYSLHHLMTMFQWNASLIFEGHFLTAKSWAAFDEDVSNIYPMMQNWFLIELLYHMNKLECSSLLNKLKQFVKSLVDATV